MRTRRSLFLGLVAVLLLSSCNRTGGTPIATDANRYYAVLLTNGSVYFGKIEGLGTSYPVLRDVFYVQSNVNQETKAVSNVLVKRGKEWHAPDRMFLNEKAIVLVEPVGSDSAVAKLISESKN